MGAFSQTGLFQRYGDRILVVEPPPEPLTTEELDAVHDLPYMAARTRHTREEFQLLRR